MRIIKKILKTIKKQLTNYNNWNKKIRYERCFKKYKLSVQDVIKIAYISYILNMSKENVIYLLKTRDVWRYIDPLEMTIMVSGCNRKMLEHNGFIFDKHKELTVDMIIEKLKNDHKMGLLKNGYTEKDLQDY